VKCTGKNRKGRYRVAAAALLCVTLFSGCGGHDYELDQPYDVYGMRLHFQEAKTTADPSDDNLYFAKGLCVGGETKAEKALPAYSKKAAAAGVFHLADGDITYSQNIYKKLYPASTTKVLTAYLALKYGDLSDTVTVSAKAAAQPADSSVCGLQAGDRLTLEELLYGLLLESGNDAAEAIAEHIGGSAEGFVLLMNEEAALLGATHSHFVNPHGLHDKQHYTCVYDLYLLFQSALKYDVFKKIIHTPKHSVTYENAEGASVTQEWESTDLFLTGEVKAPKGVTVIGGKTGTTQKAGYCLALYSENAKEQPVITIVMKADSRENLYRYMGKLLVM